MIKAIIVDDESLARRSIKTSLADFQQIEVVGECSNGIEAVKSILEQRPDLVFLDIQMPEMDGFEVIDAIGLEQMPFVVLVTAYDQYAIEAFEKHAFDYLLKPFSKKRFLDAITRVVRFIEQHRDAGINERLFRVIQDINAQRKYVSRLAIRTTTRIYFLNAEDIDWIESAGNYVDIHAGGEVHLLRETMANMEAKLNPDTFLRVHRSAIVNVNRIQEIQPDGNDFIVLLKNGKTLGMSRSYRDKLRDMINSHL